MHAAGAIRREHRIAVRFVGAHCDLEDRLAAVPPSARIRGVWFQVLLREIDRMGKKDEYYHHTRDVFSTFSFYPVSDFLIRTAVAGALRRGRADLAQGIFEISRENARRFASSVFGWSLIRVLASDPKRLAMQGIAACRQTTNYGKRACNFKDDGTIELAFRNEYVWIDSYMRGATVGAYEIAHPSTQIEVELENPFTGVIRVRPA